MRQLFFAIILLSSPLLAHDIPDRFLGQSASAVWNTIHGNITSFFEPKESTLSPAPPETIEQPHNLTPFQKLFRQTVSFTHNTSNTLTNVASQIRDEVKEKLYTVDQAADYFIQRIEDAGHTIMKGMLRETLDVDIDLLMPSFTNIKHHIHRLRQAVPQMEHAAVIDQVNQLIAYLEQAQKTASALQKAGVAKVSAKLAAHAITSKKHLLVTQFKELYAVYPTIITKLNELQIPAAGHIAHRAFNTTSELVEQIVLMHDSTGKIGPILIDNALMHPLDSLKNQVRKLGNAAEFVTSTQPLIVAAPPTTADALLEILVTFVWRDGFSLKTIAQEKIAELNSLIPPIKAQLRLLKKRSHNFKRIIAEFQPRLHAQFVAQLKESPLMNIPIAPKILLDLLEQEIEIVKSKLIVMMHASLALTYRVSRVIGIGSSLLESMNQCMGATDEQPFIHRDIIRGVGFVSQDIVGFSNIIINTAEALKEYNPIPFRDELEDVELL